MTYLLFRSMFTHGRIIDDAERGTARCLSRSRERGLFWAASQVIGARVHWQWTGRRLSHRGDSYFVKPHICPIDIVTPICRLLILVDRLCSDRYKIDNIVSAHEFQKIRFQRLAVKNQSPPDSILGVLHYSKYAQDPSAFTSTNPRELIQKRPA